MWVEGSKRWAWGTGHDCLSYGAGCLYLWRLIDLKVKEANCVRLNEEDRVGEGGGY